MKVIFKGFANKFPSLIVLKGSKVTEIKFLVVLSTWEQHSNITMHAVSFKFKFVGAYNGIYLLANRSNWKLICSVYDF